MIIHFIYVIDRSLYLCHFIGSLSLFA